MNEPWDITTNLGTADGLRTSGLTCSRAGITPLALGVLPLSVIVGSELHDIEEGDAVQRVVCGILRRDVDARTRLVRHA
jgi:hypothetical protein